LLPRQAGHDTSLLLPRRAAHARGSEGEAPESKRGKTQSSARNTPQSKKLLLINHKQ
jgi:hypothetical protein